MISIESRDGRKSLGLGFGSSVREMEETELEEGEAYDYRDDDDANIDPDVDLSYLDEKVQVVLGHFQKDFEGGVSAENLGAKFGGYGSFLPTYQRSPSIWSQPRTPQRVPSYGTPRSPNNLLLEGDLHSSAVPSGASSSAKHVTASTGAAPPPSSRAPFLESSSKGQSSSLSARSTGDCNLNTESLNKPNNMADQKTLKLRLKVGSADNMAQKTAAIFSDLGFPPSSPEDSPVESGGSSPEPHESPDGTPTSILQIMASSPVLDGVFLSPLHGGLLHLTEKEKLSKENRPSFASRSAKGTSILVDESTSVMEEGKVLGGKKMMKPIENDNRLIEMRNKIVKDVGNGGGTFLNKEIDTETPEGRELVADPLKLPVLSNSKIRTGETAKGTVRASEASTEIKKFKIKDKSISSDFAKDSVSIDINLTEKLKPRISSGEKVREDRKEKVRRDVQSLSRKENKKNNSKSYDSSTPNFDGSKGRKELNTGNIDPFENKIKLKVTSLDEEQLPYGTEQAFSGGKKRSKGSKSNGNSAAVFSQESLKAVSSTAPREKRKSSGDSSSRNKVEDSKLPREFGKTRETYRDIFGDEEMEQAENSFNSVEMPFRDRPKNYKSEVIEKEPPQFADKPKDKINGKQTYQFADKSRERPNSKKAVTAAVSESYQASLAVAPPTGNGLVPETVPGNPPYVVNENWVACDKCQKWRLLPYGIDLKDLPKKWSCSMFTWLPGMNNCRISEDDTTTAVIALNESYPIPPGSEINLQNQPHGAGALPALPEGQHLASKPQDHNLPGVSSAGKKKQGLKEIADANSFMGTMHLSHSVNKNPQASLKSRSLNDVTLSPMDSNLANKTGIQHLSKSSDSAVEKHKHKQKDGHKLAQDRGVSNHSRIKSKREADHDGSRAFKKIRTEDLINAKEEWNSDHGGVLGSSAPVIKRSGDHSTPKESELDSKDSRPSSAKKPKESLQVHLDVGASDVGKSDDRNISAKKRKVKEWQESQVYPSEPLTNANHHLESNKVSYEGTSESELRKGKKARELKSEGKTSRKSMDDAGVERRERASRIMNSVSRDFLGNEMEKSKGYVNTDQQQSEHRAGNMASQPMLDSVDPFKKDLGYGLPSVAATSSSSKVSGSRKSKANFQETKGSPVESVSSSPLRLSEKGTSARRILLGKDDATHGGFAANGSLRRCSDGEGDGGGDHSGSARKEKTNSVFHRRSLESSVFGNQDREVNPTPSAKAKAPGDTFCVVGADTLDPRIQHGERRGKEHGHDDEQGNKLYGSNGSLSRKSSKSSSLRSKDKQKGSKSDIDKGKAKGSDSLNNQDGIYPTKNSRNDMETEPQDLHYNEESRVGKYNSQEKHGVKGGKDEKSYSGKKEYFGKLSNEGRRENQLKYGGNVGPDVKSNAACLKDGKSNAQRNHMQDRAGEKSSHQPVSDRLDHDQLETASGRGKSHAFSQPGDKLEPQTRCPRPMSSNHKGNGTDLFRVDGSSGGGGDEIKVSKQPRKPDNQAGSAHNSLSHSTPGRVVGGDLDGPSPARKDSSSQAANAALKEARDLKHTADRLKSSSSGLESNRLYFEAVLKFLHGASLLEPCNIESSRHGESQSVHVYSTTTGLCEFVAQEYEKCKEMAFAALAYKCLEVARMRVIYFKHWSANKDRHELQAAVDMVPPGESPSSSASDVDNQGTADKVALAKGVGSPHIAGNHVIAARSCPTFVRVLNFTGDVYSAMEASRKSQNAFTAASTSFEDMQYEGISSVKRALDFNFYDVQGLLRLVRVAMEAISR